MRVLRGYRIDETEDPHNRYPWPVTAITIEVKEQFAADEERQARIQAYTIRANKQLPLCEDKA